MELRPAHGEITKEAKRRGCSVQWMRMLLLQQAGLCIRCKHERGESGTKYHCRRCAKWHRERVLARYHHQRQG